MTIQEMIRRKKELGLTNQQIADRSGVPLGTVQKVFGGSTETPRFHTLQALAKAFPEETRNGYYTDRSIRTDEMVADAATVYGKDHSAPKTLEDYLALPDEIRVELIDGVFYEMAGPTTIHQAIGGEIHAQLLAHVRNNEGPCMPFIAPTDVQLDCDDKTIVQPDVMVVCDRSKITRSRIVGAPDLVVEVLSPSNWYMDMVRKMRKYKASGVREYWVVIPEEKKVLVYLFEKGEEMKEYSAQDRVPVGIWDGKCMVDFEEVYERIGFLM